MPSPRFLSLDEELSHYRFCFPIMSELASELRAHEHLAGKKVGWHCHLTALTAMAAEVLVSSGVRLFLSEVNPATTDQNAVAYMRSLGAGVYTGERSPKEVLLQEPEIISDTGLVMTAEVLRTTGFSSGDSPDLAASSVKAACEITTSGITRLRRLSACPLPVININHGELKSLIENFHGVGDGLLDALSILTARLWAGRNALIIGYGRVGAGAARYLKSSGASVMVVDVDPVRRLVAHYDGYRTGGLEEGLSCSELVVTATGGKEVISGRHIEALADGCLLLNLGHFAWEIDREALLGQAYASSRHNDHLEMFLLPGDKRVYLACQGSPANVVLLSGSPEPTLIHLTCELLAISHLLAGNWVALAPGENPLPGAVERKCAELALATLEQRHDGAGHAKTLKDR